MAYREEGGTIGELLDRLKREFGNGWFTATVSRTRRATLEALAYDGYLECSKETYCHTKNFRIKEVPK